MTNKEVKEIRCRLKLSQVRFAEKLGLSQPAISAIERGRRPVTNRLAMQIDALVRKRSLSNENGEMGEEAQECTRL